MLIVHTIQFLDIKMIEKMIIEMNDKKHLRS